MENKKYQCSNCHKSFELANIKKAYDFGTQEYYYYCPFCHKINSSKVKY